MEGPFSAIQTNRNSSLPPLSSPPILSDSPHLAGIPEDGGCAYHHHCIDPKLGSRSLPASKHHTSTISGTTRTTPTPGKQKGVLIVCGGRSANCAKRDGAKCSRLQEGDPLPMGQGHKGVRKEVTPQLPLVEAGMAYAKAPRQECWGCMETLAAKSGT